MINLQKFGFEDKRMARLLSRLVAGGDPADSEDPGASSAGSGGGFGGAIGGGGSPSGEAGHAGDPADGGASGFGGGGSPSGEAGQLSNNPADAGQHNASVQAASNLAGYTGSAPGGPANAAQITAITEPYKKAFKSTFINDLKTVAMFAVAPISTLAKSILGRTNDIASMKSQLSALGLTEAQVNAAISDVYSGAVDFGQGPDGSGDRSLVNTIVAGVQPNGTLSGDGPGDGESTIKVTPPSVTAPAPILSPNSNAPSEGNGLLNASPVGYGLLNAPRIGNDVAALMRNKYRRV